MKIIYRVIFHCLTITFLLLSLSLDSCDVFPHIYDLCISHQGRHSTCFSGNVINTQVGWVSIIPSTKSLKRENADIEIKLHGTKNANNNYVVNIDSLKICFAGKPYDYCGKISCIEIDVLNQWLHRTGNDIRLTNGSITISTRPYNVVNNGKRKKKEYANLTKEQYFPIYIYPCDFIMCGGQRVINDTIVIDEWKQEKTIVE